MTGLKERAKDAALMTLLLPAMAVAFVLSIPPVAVVMASWWWRKRRCGREKDTTTDTASDA